MVIADLPLRSYKPRSHLATSANSSAHCDRGWLYTGLPEHQYSAIVMPSTWDMACVPGQSQQPWHMTLSLGRQTLNLYYFCWEEHGKPSFTDALYTADNRKNKFFFSYLQTFRILTLKMHIML